ncbi:DNA polymerase III subunit alpha [Oceanobacillus sp. CAU 1775]
MSYTHLQVRSGFSLMNSTITIKKLVAKARELNFSALALTDEQVLYGVIPFYKACKQANIKPIIGMIINITNENNDESNRLVLLAKNHTGYKSLVKLSTKLQVEKKPGIMLEELKNNVDGLIGILPATDPELTRKLDTDTFANVNDYINTYETLFAADDFYIGIEKENHTTMKLKQYCEIYPSQVTALSDVHYLEERDVYSFDCLRAMDQGNVWKMQLSDPTYNNKHLKTEEEIEVLLGGFWPEAIKETEKIKEKCNLEFDFSKKLLPRFPLPDEKNAHEFLKEQCYSALEEKYPNQTEEVKNRVAYELSTIETMEFSDYFLIIADIIAFAKKEGIMVGPGRGSSAGSIVAYLLGITDVDPIAYNLLFERFLNPERQTMPDIDIDFSDERRDEVIAYVKEKYGSEHVAQIVTFGTFAARSLVRELIKTLEVAPEDARFILKELPTQSSGALVDMVKESKELTDYIKQSQKLKALFTIAVKLEGIPRHISTHAAGVVISELPLIEHVPLTVGANETALTQFAMNDLESIGLLKMDFLGLRNLSLIERIMKSIYLSGKRRFNLDEIPVNDEKTFAMLRQGRANGVFQLESQGMQRVLKELQPTGFEDIVAVNALYRPGPMDFIPTYINRKHGREPVAYPHQDLAVILEKTYGVLVYQEQIMEIAKVIAGYSLGKADILRRAVSKKNKEVMAEEREGFIRGCMANGYTEKVAEEIFSWIVRFSNYGFPRSHAVAYSKISYQLSYLKANYPANFFAELISSSRNQQEKINLYVSEMNETNIDLLPPSINKSIGIYKVENDGLRMGFYSIKGVGRDAVAEIIRARGNNKFKNIFDFCLRVSNKIIKRGTMEQLIMAGAFDETYANRASLLASLDQALNQGELFREFSEQSSLFYDQIELEEQYVEIEDFTIAKKLQDEKDLLGMYVSSHPLENYREGLRRSGFVSIADTKELVGRKHVNGAVIVQEIKQIRTKRGDQMAFLTLADENSTIDAVLFPDLYREEKRWLEEEMLIFIKGKIEMRNDRLQWVIDKVEPFDEARLEEEAEKIIFIKSTKETNANALEFIGSVAKAHPGNVPIILYDEETKQSYKLATNYYLHSNTEALNKLKNLFGKENVVQQKR